MVNVSILLWLGGGGGAVVADVPLAAMVAEVRYHWIGVFRMLVCVAVAYCHSIFKGEVTVFGFQYLFTCGGFD